MFQLVIPLEVHRCSVSTSSSKTYTYTYIDTHTHTHFPIQRGSNEIIAIAKFSIRVSSRGLALPFESHKRWKKDPRDWRCVKTEPSFDARLCFSFVSPYSGIARVFFYIRYKKRELGLAKANIMVVSDGMNGGFSSLVASSLYLNKLFIVPLVV